MLDVEDDGEAQGVDHICSLPLVEIAPLTGIWARTLHGCKE